MKQKVLATSWHPGGMNAIIPVIKRLRQEQKVDVVTIGHHYSETILSGHKIAYHRINDYGLENVSVESMATLLDQENPDLILTGTSAQDENNKEVIEHTITLAGRKKKIPTIAVLDSWMNYSLRFNDINSGENFRFLPDTIAIMDHYAEKDMLAEGFDQKRLVITGNPHFDDLESKAREFTKERKNELKLQIGLDVKVLFFYAAGAWKKQKPQWGYWDLDNIQLMNEVLKEMTPRESQECGVAVKLHPRVPSEDLGEIKTYIEKEAAERIKLVSGLHPHDLVLASDLTLTPNSTVGIEAVYMGKPTLSIQPHLQGEDYLAILTKNKIIPVGYTPEQCRALVQKAFVDREYREKELIEQSSSFRIDGKATERVAELIYQNLESR